MTSAQTNLRDAVAHSRAKGQADSLLENLEKNSELGDGFAPWLATQLGMSAWGTRELLGLTPDFTLLPYAQTVRHRCAVVTREDGNRLLILVDPFDVDRIAWAHTRLQAPRMVLTSSSSFDAWLAHCESSMSALSTMMTTIEARDGLAATKDNLNLLHIGEDQSPAVRFVNSTLYDGLKTGASDIHLESTPTGLCVKFRIDGVLSLQRIIDNQDLASQAISRIKVMAQLDIAERRVPQDGRLQISYEGRPIDVRVSIMPSIHGEDAVLRILDRQHLAESLEGLTLGKLGFSEEARTAILRLCNKPHGMLLVTGPTGSGKTTTLYAAIAETLNTRDKVITIEDPVEYQLPGVLQIPVNERKGLTFARGLRSILRHDPDKILVGEIRDTETAQIAVQSALTGHLVYTTVHANNAFDAVGRFTQFGIDAYTFASAINGILAQRLFRKVCVHCASAASEHDTASHLTSIDTETTSAITAPRWLRAHGCEMCRGTGYSGRFALGELVELTPPLKGLIASRAPFDQLEREAHAHGWRSLRTLALQAAAKGMTTLEEVNRVAS